MDDGCQCMEDILRRTDSLFIIFAPPAPLRFRLPPKRDALEESDPASFGPSRVETFDTNPANHPPESRSASAPAPGVA